MTSRENQELFSLSSTRTAQSDPLSSACISGGRGPSLSISPTSHSHVLRPRKKASFNLVAILYTCFRFKYAIFRKKIIRFEAVKRKNNFYKIGQFTAKKLAVFMLETLKSSRRI